jgi:hypothetical protein
MVIYAAWQCYYNYFRSLFKSIIIKLFRIFTQNTGHLRLFSITIATKDNYPRLNCLPFRLPARKNYTPTGEIVVEIDIVGFTTSRLKDILFWTREEKIP